MDQRRWSPSSDSDYEQVVGRDVYTHDGERIGRVERIVHPASNMEGTGMGHYLVVRPDELTGPLGADNAFVPEEAVAVANRDAVELTVDAKHIAQQGWAHLPANLNQQDAPLPEDVPPPTEGGWYEEGHRTAE